MRKTFETTEATASMFPTMSDLLKRAAFDAAEDFVSAGQTTEQACSIVAHLMIRQAWVTAALGALTDGREPQKDRFRAAVEDALESFRFSAPDPQKDDGGDRD